jgi:hypothetical protein
MRTQECYDDLALTAALALQSFADFRERVVIAQIRTQLGQVEARAVPTGAARRSIVVRFVNVFEPSGFEAGVFHPLTLPPPGSGLLGYNSYSN